MSSLKLSLLVIIVIFLGMYSSKTQAISPVPADLYPIGDTSHQDSAVHTKAAFVGDVNQYIKSHIQYPSDASAKKIQGAVVVSFEVSTAGAIQNATITRSLFPSLDAEALRIVNSMPAWTPAKTDGSAVSSNCKLPVLFKL